MAREEDDDGKLAPLGDDTEKFLEDAKKGKPRSFLLVCKGAKVRYLAVRKKPVKKAELNEAKKLGYKGDAYFGIITGKGMELIFNLPREEYDAEPVKDKVLKDFLEEHAGLKAKPSFQLVDTLPAIPFDDEDLKHPLIAKFMKLDGAISQVLDKRPDAESELVQRVTEIRGLLQDADFDAAGPKIDGLVTRIKELLALTPSSQPTDTGGGNANQGEPAVEPEVMRAKLQDALNKLVPQLKQFVAANPERKVEMLTPVAAIKQQIEQGQFDAARQGLLAVGKLLKEAVAKSPGRENNHVEREQYQAKLAALQPRYAEALAKMLGDTGKFKAIMAYAQEQSDAGVFANGIKALDRLAPLIDQALSGAVGKETDIIPENVVADRKKFVASRWQEMVRRVNEEIDKLRDPALFPGADPDEVDEISNLLTAAVHEFTDDLNAAILGVSQSSSENLKPIELAQKTIENYRTLIPSHPIIKHLSATKASVGVNVDVERTMLEALDELASHLVP